MNIDLPFSNGMFKRNIAANAEFTGEKSQQKQDCFVVLDSEFHRSCGDYQNSTDTDKQGGSGLGSFEVGVIFSLFTRNRNGRSAPIVQLRLLDAFYKRTALSHRALLRGFSSASPKLRRMRLSHKAEWQ